VLERNTLKSIGIESGKALLRYSQIVITREELESMHQNIAAEEAKRLELMKIYNQSKAENEERAQLDAKYAKVGFNSSRLKQCYISRKRLYHRI
jgi:hypothetical protein